MKNTIKVTIPFSFKGKEHAPSAVIDLDTFILGEQTLDSAFQIVANENKIDNYSYEYEVLESSKKIFSEPTGIAADFLTDSDFDLAAFKDQKNNLQGLEILESIARDVLDIESLDDNEKIKQALLAAYKAGQTGS